MAIFELVRYIPIGYEAPLILFVDRVYCAPLPNQCAGVAELADAPDSKSGDGNIVWVRFPPPAPFPKQTSL